MPGPKTRSTKKNTAPKGVAPIGPSNENYLFPGVPSSVVEPRKISWPQITSNPSDRGYLEPYDPLTGLPTGQAPINPYIPQMQPYTMYGPPMPPGGGAATPTSAAPNVPPYVGGGQSGLVPWVNPATGRVEMPPAGDGYAKNLTTGNVPVGNSYADWQAWNKQMETSDPNWSYYNPYTAQYAWQWNPKEPGTLMAGADPRSQEGVPWHEELNIPWSSSYAPEFYSTQQRNPLTALWGGSNKGTMGTRGWRRPKSSYLPEQQQYMDADGNKWFERPEMDTRSRMQKLLDEQNPSGNNTLKTIPAWVGPLVSWRT